MKIFKRNAIIITVILFVCVAVYLNWSYNRREAELSAESYQASEETGLFYTLSDESIPVSAASSKPNTAQSDYFSNARLTRSQARDSAVSALREAAEMDSASSQAVDSTLDAISVMSSYAVTEAEIESLVMAKGFSDCIAFVDDGSVVVAVPAPAEGLSISAVSRITDAIVSQTDCGTEQIKIIEVK